MTYREIINLIRLNDGFIKFKIFYLYLEFIKSNSNNSTTFITIFLKNETNWLYVFLC